MSLNDTKPMAERERHISTAEQERSKIVTGLEAEQAQGGLLFAQTDHFIVVYRDIPDIYGEFSGWLDTHPTALAQHLEYILEAVTGHFHLNLQDNFQVVEVKKGGLFVLDGVHLGNTRSLLSLKAWEHARFSKVYSGKRRAGFDEPVIYGAAVHEAIGHGIVERGLFGEEVLRKRPYQNSPELGFLIEGLATYIEYTFSGADPHDYFRNAMLDAAISRFTDLGGRWKLDSLSEDQIRGLVGRYSRIDGFSISGVFKLQERPVSGYHTEEPMDRVDLSNLFAKYSRGGSFVKYLIDRFGREAFQEFARRAGSSYFFSSLEEVTGMAVEAVERSWKEEVLTEAFIRNPIIEARERDVSTKFKRELEAQRRSILNLYRAYA